MYWLLSTAKDEELRKKREALRAGEKLLKKKKREALRAGEKLLKKKPELKTEEDITWREEGAGENLRLLSELLKGNAIPTKDLNLHGDEKEWHKRGIMVKEKKKKKVG